MTATDQGVKPDASIALIVAAVCAAAIDGRITVDEVERIVDDDVWLPPTADDDAAIARPDAEAVFEAVASAGISIEDGVTDADLDAAAEEIERAELSPDAPLDALSIWRRQTGNHRVLGPAEELEMTQRLVTLRITANALESSASRLRNRLAAAEAEAEAAFTAADALDDSDPALPDAVEALRLARERAAALAEPAAAAEYEARQARKRAIDLRDRFLHFNFKLVWFIAKKKYSQSRGRADLNDLIQQGNEGVTIAANKFDPARGFKFSTFATYYIRQKTAEYSMEQVGSGPRVPTNRQRQYSRLVKTTQELFERNGAEPTHEMLAAELKWPMSKIVTVLAANQAKQAASLDKPIGEDGDSTTLGEVQVDLNAISPEDQVVRDDIRDVTRERLRRLLTPRERRVVMLRSGMDGDNRVWTLEDCGTRLTITRERVRQIQEAAFKKLRADDYMREAWGLPVPAHDEPRETVSIFNPRTGRTEQRTRRIAAVQAPAARSA